MKQAFLFLVRSLVLPSYAVISCILRNGMRVSEVKSREPRNMYKILKIERGKLKSGQVFLTIWMFAGKKANYAISRQVPTSMMEDTLPRFQHVPQFPTA